MTAILSGMLTVTAFLLLPFACSTSEPPPEPEVEAADEPAPTPKKRPRSASQVSDTGADMTDLIEAIRYRPEKPLPNENVSVIVELGDTEGFVDVDYEWEVNGRRLLSERSEELAHRRYSKGDTIQAFLSIRIGDETITREAARIVVGNTPPRILTNPKSLSTLDGFRIRGEDPDGGAVTYHVTGGPPGMTIGEQTGVVRYKPSKTAEGGEYPMTFIVRDEDKAESEWRLTVNVSPGSQSASAKAARAQRKADWEAEQAAKRAQREAAAASEGQD